MTKKELRAQGGKGGGRRRKDGVAGPEENAKQKRIFRENSGGGRLGV